MKSALLKSLSKQNKTVLVLISCSIVLIASALPISRTESKEIQLPFSQQYIQDPAIELGETQTRQPGNKGRGLEKKKVIIPIFSLITGIDFTYHSTSMPTETVAPPTDEIIANGSKKFQYMLCSDGSYRYYTNEQFAEPLNGFTHKSPDECTNNNHGHMTSLSDSAPQQQPTRTVYTPSYTPTYRPPVRCYTQYNTYGGYFDPSANTTCY